MKDGAAILLFLVIVTKSGDTAAYMTGTVTNRPMNGNHKIVPSISPKKSWEGTFGGLVCSVVLSLCFRGLLPFEFSFSVALLTGVLLFAGGFIGDLLESCMKRACGVKDSASIVPGMGGVLDILDSFLINAPLFYIFLNYGNI
jgi:phosphatidate cytidylyltransferase